MIPTLIDRYLGQGSLGLQSTYSKGVSLALHEHDTAGWRHQLRALRQLAGVRHVELCLEDVLLTRDEVLLLRELLDGRAVLLRAPVLQLSMISHHEVVRGAAAEVFRRALELGDELGASVVTFVGGTRPRFVDEGVALEQVAAMFSVLREWGAAAQPALQNLTGAQEVLRGYPSSLDEMTTCLRRITDLRVTLDLGACLAAREGWSTFLRERCQRVIALRLRLDAAEGMKWAGEVAALAALLRSISYWGFLSLGASGTDDLIGLWRRFERAEAEALSLLPTALTTSAPDARRVRVHLED